jgi:hypothetical protein
LISQSRGLGDVYKRQVSVLLNLLTQFKRQSLKIQVINTHKCGLLK